jgi:hypothetical protein
MSKKQAPLAVEFQAYEPEVSGAKRCLGQGSLFKRTVLGLTRCLFVALLLSASVESVVNAQVTSSSNLPDNVIAQLPSGGRFKDPVYFNLMLGGSLKTTSSKVIFERMTAAANLKENYKALYLARIFTELEPKLAAGWANRAALATALNLKDEANACVQKANDPSANIQVPIDTLPGHMSTQPTSLADWAAAMALLADGTAAKSGQNSMIAVRDDISGIQVPSSEEVKENDEELVELGLPPDGPWSAPAPIRLNQVAPNSFLLVKPEAMHYKTVKKASMFGAMLMAGLSGMTAVSNPVASAAGSEVAGEMASDATNVANHYTGGSYTKVVFVGDPTQTTATVDHPIPAGKSHAVGNPVPILWASGHSDQPTYLGHWSAGTKPLVIEHHVGKKEDPKHRAKTQNVPDLEYPRLGILCSKTCSIPVSTLELMLTRDDLVTISPSTIGSLPPDLDLYRTAYTQNALTLLPSNLRERWYLGFDSKANAYEINSTPAGWLVPPASR